MSEGFDEAPAAPPFDETRHAVVETGQGLSGDDEHVSAGNATVDEVLESLDRLEGAPVSDHVAVFETAHEKLRGALAEVVTDQQTS